jgi:hypothetical protein
MSTTGQQRILLRAAKSPLRAAQARETLDKNLIGTNSGNLIFSQAAVRMLTTSRTSVLTEIFNAKQTDAAWINERFDHFVIPLANAFRPDFSEHLEQMSACIEQLKIPVTVFGVGAQAVGEGDPAELAPLASHVRRFVGAVLNRSASIGVRGEFTANYLKSLGFGSSQVEIIGCPSMFLTDGVEHVPTRAPKLTPQSRVAINLTPHINGIREMAERHRKAYRNIRYVAQDSRDLRIFLQRGWDTPQENLDGAPITPRDPILAPATTAFYLDPRTWIEELTQVDVAFGTRIHGNVAALLAGRPAYVLAHDSRTLELARYFEIPYTDVSGPRGVTDINTAELFANADYAAMKSNHASRLRTTCAFLERNGLHHIYEPGESPSEFDAAMNALNLPPAVRAASPIRAAYRALRRKMRKGSR